MMIKRMPRDILELNQFQLSVLRPFYAASFFVALFFAMMCYVIFTMPQSQNVETILLTQCEPAVSPLLLGVSFFSLVLSLIAFGISARTSSMTTLAKQSPGIGDRTVLMTLISATALLLSLFVIVFLAFKIFGFQRMTPTVDFMTKGFDPKSMMVIIPSVGVMFSIFVLFRWAYQITNKVLGPYERIIHDLDDMIERKLIKKLYVRPGDKMFGELIARINILLKKHRGGHHDGQSD